jgi:phenylphosphate carboxylase alpha subunit
MALADVREFIEAIERTGDLVRVRAEVDWDLEMGAIIRRTNERWGPAPLFENIRGCPPGYRALGGPVATYRRMATAMGLPPETRFPELMEEYGRRTSGRVKPVVVDRGPCQEIVRRGEDVDVTEFPAPVMHGGDGGRYLGSWEFGVCRDPGTGWVNWGTYRLMIRDRNTFGINFSVTSHGMAILQQYERMGEPMPYAAVIGGDPCLGIVASSGVPYGVDEVDVAGALRGEAVELVKCQTNDLYVPASAELVLEGEILAGERQLEGPHGEFGGYQTEAKMKPVFRVHCITQRRDPILTLSCTGMPPEDWHILASITMSLEFRASLEQAGVPVRGIYVPPQYSTQLCIVSVDAERYPCLAEKVANCVWSTRIGIVVGKVIVVDADCDPTNLDQVWHAFTTKCHPIEGTHPRPKAPVTPLIPYLWPEERRTCVGAVTVYDCTWPREWPRDMVPAAVSFAQCYPEEIRQRVLARWDEYGFQE